MACTAGSGGASLGRPCSGARRRSRLRSASGARRKRSRLAELRNCLGRSSGTALLWTHRRWRTREARGGLESRAAGHPLPRRSSRAAAALLVFLTAQIEVAALLVVLTGRDLAGGRPAAAGGPPPAGAPPRGGSSLRGRSQTVRQLELATGLYSALAASLLSSPASSTSAVLVGYNDIGQAAQAKPSPVEWGGPFIFSFILHNELQKLVAEVIRD
ncbi:unnamed protein product [Urochloa humidicola]